MVFRSWFVLLFGISVGLAQYAQEEKGYLRSPKMTSQGIVCTDNFGSALYLVQSGKIQTLTDAPGCGLFFSLSPDGGCVGYKLIDTDGLQTPAMIDLTTHVLRTVHSAEKRIGQISFANNGQYAFTVGEKLLLIDGTSEREYNLGYYANLAPISPDGMAAAFNDADDQLWILDLNTGKRTRITNNAGGFFTPQWSPDGSKILYNALNGNGFVFEMTDGATYQLGEAVSPAWTSDSRSVVFYRKEIKDGTLVNTDLFLATYDGSSVLRMTNTPEVCEMDPQISADGNQVLYHTYDRRQLCLMSLDEAQSLETIQVISDENLVPVITPISVQEKPLQKSSKTATLDIPYVHQVYDTPDWHNGNSSCAATAGVMVLAYYNILPPWPTWVTDCTRYGIPAHYSNWGSYIADKFQFAGVNFANYYNSSAPAWGMHAYLWTSGSPYTRMAGMYQIFGMSASQTDATPHSSALAEIQGGRPFTMCVLLTTAGHVVIAHGVGLEEHTFVFNDPYGDKNLGYKNNYGKNVQYDWPGYNNGHQNLIQVAWCIATQFTPVAILDTVVDDLQFNSGFYLHNRAPATMTLWKDLTRGYQGHLWYKNTTVADTCYAVWTPQISAEGYYEVFAYIPNGFRAKANYTVTALGGTHDVQIDQSAFADSWTSLGIYAFLQGSSGSVRLGDRSDSSGVPIVFDALRWSWRGTSRVISPEGSLPLGLQLNQNYPNPFNPETVINYELSMTSLVKLAVYDLMGREVATLVNEIKSAGWYSVTWNASHFSSGVYFYKIQVGQFQETKQMILLK